MVVRLRLMSLRESAFRLGSGGGGGGVGGGSGSGLGLVLVKGS